MAVFRLLRDAANKRLDVFKPNQTILKIIKFPTHRLYIVLTSDDGFKMLGTLKKMIYLIKVCLITVIVIPYIISAAIFYLFRSKK